MAKSVTIEEYVDGVTGTLREIVDKLTPIIDAELPGANRAVWHTAPTWSLGAAPGKAPVCFVKAHTAYVTLAFWRGQAISDPSGLLEPASRGMSHAKFRAVSDVDVELVADWIRQAKELELAELAQNG